MIHVLDVSYDSDWMQFADGFADCHWFRIGLREMIQLLVYYMKLILYLPNLLLLQLQLLPGLNLPEWSHHTSPNQSLIMHLPLHYSSQTSNGHENYS